MPDRLTTHRARDACAGRAAIACIAIALAARAGAAQTPAPAMSPPLAPYRAPAIVLAQPAAGTPLPADRPVVVLRFAPGEADDPIDTRSLRVALDGEDRTPLFQATAEEAWGPLAPVSGSAIAPGVHHLTARICSIRGACGTVEASITVAESAAVTTGEPKRHRLVGALLRAIRVLLMP